MIVSLLAFGQRTPFVPSISPSFTSMSNSWSVALTTTIEGNRATWSFWTLYGIPFARKLGATTTYSHYGNHHQFLIEERASHCTSISFEPFAPRREWRKRSSLCPNAYIDIGHITNDASIGYKMVVCLATHSTCCTRPICTVAGVERPPFTTELPLRFFGSSEMSCTSFCLSSFFASIFAPL